MIPENLIVAGVRALIEPARTLDGIPEWRMLAYRDTVTRIIEAVADDLWLQGHAKENR